MGESVPLNPHSSSSGTAEPSPFLTPARWQQIKELFSLALERDADQRADYLQQACGDDEELRAEVESLLDSAESYGAATSKVFKSVTPPDEPSSGEVEDPLIGQRVGDYRIDQRIGFGGMAAVYLASRADEQFHMRAAIKLLRPDMNHADLLRRFLKERQTLAALDHPNIVKLLDGGTTETGLPYLVMDYVEGKPIDEYCDDHNLPIQKRLQLFCTVCEAVEFAHQHRVIHRDLKPNNILATADGIPKLLDFGIAKILDPDSSEPALLVTHTMQRRMTLAYASPEQVRGEAVRPASDVYSLGVVLYELLSGHRPYRLKLSTPIELEQAICEQEPESPSTAVDRVVTEPSSDGTSVTKTPELVSLTREGEPEKLRRRLRGDLDNIVLKALRKEPQRRYASAQQLLSDIQRYLEHRPVLARRPTFSYRTSKFIRRHRSELVASVAIFSVFLTALAFTVWRERRGTEKLMAELSSQKFKARRSVAVFGFKNLSGHAETEWLSTALSEMLTTELTAGGILRGVSGENVALAKMNLGLADQDSLSRQTLDGLYKNLGSDYVVLGSYVDTGGGTRSIRLNLRLWNASSEETSTLVEEGGTEMDLFDLAVRAGAHLRRMMGLAEVNPSDLAAIRASLPSNSDAVRLYTQALARLRTFDALGARDLLQKALALEPGFALAHSALSEAWSRLGYDENAKEEAQRAFDLTSSLSREHRLWIEARYRETNHEWERVAQICSALFEFFPDNVDYGLKLSAAQLQINNYSGALATVDALHALPPPLGDDPRIDWQEVSATDKPNETKRRDAALQRVIDKSRALGNRTLLAQALILLAEYSRQRRDFDKVFPLLQQAADVSRQVGDMDGYAYVLHATAKEHWLNDDRAAARGPAEEALSIYRTSGNAEGIARAANGLGIVLAEEGDLDGARKLLMESLAACRQIRSKVRIADGLLNLGMFLAESGDLEEGRGMEQEAAGIYRQLGNRGVEMAMGNIAQILYWEGDLPGAERVLKKTMRTARGKITQPDTGLEGVIAGLQATLGEIRLVQASFSEAKKYLEESQAFNVRYPSQGLNEAMGDLDLARVAFEQALFSEEEKLARDAATKFRKGGSLQWADYAEAQVALSLVSQGKNEESGRILRSIQPLAIKEMDVRLPVLITAARVQLALGNHANPSEIQQARQWLTTALSEASKHGYLEYQYDARLTLGEMALRAGDAVSGRQLASLESEASAKGFILIARKAASARNQN
jgi:serine/threonine protein kinase/TolB-like protein/Flp pilus assembly protein TadD